MGRLFQILILIGLAAIVWRLVRNALTPAPPAGPAPGDAQAFEPTAKCAACGTFVPKAQLNSAGVCPRCRSAA